MQVRAQIQTEQAALEDLQSQLERLNQSQTRTDGEWGTWERGKNRRTYTIMSYNNRANWPRQLSEQHCMLFWFFSLFYTTSKTKGKDSPLPINQTNRPLPQHRVACEINQTHIYIIFCILRNRLQAAYNAAPPPTPLRPTESWFHTSHLAFGSIKQPLPPPHIVLNPPQPTWTPRERPCTTLTPQTPLPFPLCKNRVHYLTWVHDGLNAILGFSVLGC